MNIKDFTSRLPKKVTQKIIAVIFLIMIFFNVKGLNVALKQISKYKKVVKQQNIGFRFDGLKDHLQDVQTIGFFTDLNLKKNRNSKDLAHAQYMLAPVIIDATSLEYRYVLMFCADPQNAIKQMKAIRAIPVIGNNSGVVLTERVDFR